MFFFTCVIRHVISYSLSTTSVMQLFVPCGLHSCFSVLSLTVISIFYTAFCVESPSSSGTIFVDNSQIKPASSRATVILYPAQGINMTKDGEIPALNKKDQYPASTTSASVILALKTRYTHIL